MIPCSSCNRYFKNRNSLRCHRSQFHRRNEKDDDLGTAIEHDNWENDVSTDSRPFDSTSTYEEEDTIDNPAQDLDLDHNILRNHPKFLKMICKGILNRSIPINEDLRTKLKTHATLIRDIAVIRIQKMRDLLDDQASDPDMILQLILMVYHESINPFKKK